jgi:hypothetical protein
MNFSKNHNLQNNLYSKAVSPDTRGSMAMMFVPQKSFRGSTNMEKKLNDMFIFRNEHGDGYWFKGDYTGYYVVWSDNRITEFDWSDIEYPLGLLESSSFATDHAEAVRVRELISPYYHKKDFEETLDAIVGMSDQQTRGEVIRSCGWTVEAFDKALDEDMIK